MENSFDLERFVQAQADLYKDVVSELTDGAKRTHWMWFIFPQVEGLGHSEFSRRFGIRSRDEATAYLGHPILGPRLRHCVELMLQHENKTARQILGSPDDLKFQSCLTLFVSVDTAPSRFQEALKKYFDGSKDVRTLEILSGK